eukprot:s72_g33.t1
MQLARAFAAICLGFIASLSLQGCSSTEEDTTAATATVTATTTAGDTVTATMTTTMTVTMTSTSTVTTVCLLISMQQFERSSVHGSRWSVKVNMPGNLTFGSLVWPRKLDHPQPEGAAQVQDLSDSVTSAKAFERRLKREEA